jgi:O-acetylserine/cysteine efflux transporter
MKPADVCLAVLVALIWGFGFVATRLALDELSPALMTTLRFSIAAVPCLFVRKPDVSWRLLAAISSTLFLGQFLAQSWAIAKGVPVGLASVIVQSQALFTVAFAALAFGEIPTRLQIAGIGVAAIGLLMICGTVGFDFSVGAFAVLMISPITFAVGNLLLRRANGVPMFDLFAWLCLVPPLPLLALTLLTDGPQATWHSLSQMSPTGLISMLFIGSAPCGSPAWSRSFAASPSCCCRSGRRPHRNRPRRSQSCPGLREGACRSRCSQPLWFSARSWRSRRDPTISWCCRRG